MSPSPTPTESNPHLRLVHSSTPPAGAYPKRMASTISPLITLSVFLMPPLILAPHPTTYVLAPLAPLFLAAPFSLKARYYLRVLSFVLGLGVCSLWGVVSALAVSVVRPSWRRNVQWLVARSFYGLVAPLVGWEFEVIGEEYLKEASEGKPHVLVGNHQSMIDILYLGRIFPQTCVVMAKKELQYMPLLGQFMSMSRAVFVDRQNRSTAVATFRKVSEEMKRLGLNLFIFAEGTRSASSGAFHLAIEAQIPIIPIVCENYHSLYSTRHSRFKSGKLVLRVLPPIETKGVYDVADVGSAGELAEKTREKMMEALIELSERPGAASAPTGSKEEEEKIRKLVGEGKKSL